MEGNAFSRFFRWLGKDLKEIGLTFAEGDWKTRLSFLIMGFGQLLRGQLVRGLSMLALEGGILYYVISFGWGYLKNILTLGVIETHKEGRRTVYGDNSFMILLYGLRTIVRPGRFCLYGITGAPRCAALSIASQSPFR